MTRRRYIISPFLAIIFLCACALQAFPAGSGDSSNGNFSFIAVSDTHLGDEEATERFLKIVEHVNFRKPAFFIICGDNVDVDSKEQWEEFDRLTSKLEVPLHTAIGNHDSYLSTRLYKKHRGKLFYSFGYGNSHFIVLDNAQKFNNATLFMQPGNKPAQWKWLREDIKTPAAHKFVFFHFPVYGSRSMLDPQYMQATPPEKRRKEVDEMIKLFKENGVEYIVFGHRHSYEREVREGIVHLRTGGGGGSRASHTGEENVGFVQFFVGPDSVEDVPVYIYGEAVELSFGNPKKALIVGESVQYVVDGIDANGRRLAAMPEFSVRGDIGEITPDGLFTAKRAGEGAVVAKEGELETGLSVVVKKKRR